MCDNATIARVFVGAQQVHAFRVWFTLPFRSHVVQVSAPLGPRRRRNGRRVARRSVRPAVMYRLPHPAVTYRLPRPAVPCRLLRQRLLAARVWSSSGDAPLTTPSGVLPLTTTSGLVPLDTASGTVPLTTTGGSVSFCPARLINRCWSTSGDTPLSGE